MDSSNLFALAQEAGYNLKPGHQEPIEDQLFLKFRDRYLGWTKERDASLLRHLDTKSNRFRTLVPYTNRAFPLIYSLWWYFDEILIKDPVAVLLKAEPGEENLKDRKKELGELLGGLAQFRTAIEAQRVLLYGPGVLSIAPPSDQLPGGITELANDAGIAESLEREIRFGLDVRPGAEGLPWHVYEGHLDRAFSIGWVYNQPDRPLAAGDQGPPIRWGERLPPATREDITTVLGEEQTNELMRDLCAREIYGTLEMLRVASSIGAGPLFDRKADGAIIQRSAEPLPEAALAIQALNLSLPYLAGVPPEALADLREKEPLAFVEFRSQLHDLVTRAAEGKVDGSLEAAAEREVVPQLRLLEAEMDSLLRKLAAAGFSLGLVVGTGALMASVLHAGLATILAPLGADALRTILRSPDQAASLRRNPYYWLWKARSS